MRASVAARLRLYRELLGAFSARAAAVCLIQEASDMVGKSLFFFVWEALLWCLFGDFCRFCRQRVFFEKTETKKPKKASGIAVVCYWGGFFGSCSLRRECFGVEWCSRGSPG